MSYHKKLKYYQQKAIYNLLLGRTHLTSIDGYQKNFVFFPPMLNSLILYKKKKVTNWISTRVLSKKIKPFDANLASTMTNLVNGKVSLRFNNLFLGKKVILRNIVTSF